MTDDLEPVAVSTLTVPVTTWDALTDAQRAGLANAADLPRLGTPAIYTDTDGVDQCVFDDHRLTVDHIATLGVLLADPTLIEVPDVDPI